jgi:hypothetical protein
MQRHYFLAAIVAGLTILTATNCSPATPTPLPMDMVIQTMAIQLASSMQTQTAAAYTPPPLFTATLESTPTETPTPEPTFDQANHTVIVITHAPCWFGPGSYYPLESYISQNKKVELLGVGSIPGWYVIRNPYFYQPCWIQASDLQIDPRLDLSVFPIITPRP